MRDLTKSVRFTGLMLLLGVVGAASLSGQDPRDAQVSRAFHEFDTARRQQILMSVLNPTYGPPRGAWTVGVQLLAQTLLEDGKDSAAAVLLRWAIRLSPEMEPDTVTFLPEVIAAYRSARDYVTSTTRPADSLVETTWLWPVQASSDPVGRLQIVPTEQVPMRAAARGIGRLVPGGSIPFHIGSYFVVAGAPGYDSVGVTREVLPGVTTVLEFRLRTATAQVVTKAPERPRSRQPQLVSSRRKKKGFPALWVGLGAASAVVVAAILGSNGSPAPTGSVTVTIPSSP